MTEEKNVTIKFSLKGIKWVLLGLLIAVITINLASNIRIDNIITCKERVCNCVKTEMKKTNIISKTQLIFDIDELENVKDKALMSCIKHAVKTLY